MRISKKQTEFIKLVEKCGYLLINEINHQQYPSSMLDALIEKGLLSKLDNKLISTTKPTK